MNRRLKGSGENILLPGSHEMPTGLCWVTSIGMLAGGFLAWMHSRYPYCESAGTHTLSLQVFPSGPRHICTIRCTYCPWAQHLHNSLLVIPGPF